MGGGVGGRIESVFSHLSGNGAPHNFEFPTKELLSKVLN